MNRTDDFNRMLKSTTTLKPTYIRVRKDYERDGSYALDCMWVQLLEKLWHTINSDYHGGTSEDDSKPLFMDILRNGLEQNQTMIRISIDRFINSLKTDGSLSEKDADKLKKRPGRNNSSEPYVLTLQTAIRTA